MYRLIIPLFVGISLFLASIPIHEPVTNMHEVLLIFMVWSCIMVQRAAFNQWRADIIHVKTEITMTEILDRYPEYHTPRTSHRLG